MPELDPPIQTLFGPAPEDLPAPLLMQYGGGLGLPPSAVYANFVTSLDGVVAIADIPASSTVIGGRDDGDRFVMALLRSAADAVLVGAGTFREHGGPWAAGRSAPGGAEAFAELRRREGRAPRPTLAIVSASGKLEPKEGDARQDTIVLTTPAGAGPLEHRSADFTEIVVVGEGEDVDGAGAIAALRERGFERVLTEGGPGLMAELFEARVVDELFLTVSPVLAGGGDSAGARSTLAPGLEFLPGDRVTGSLRSVKQRDAYLFLRYGLSRGTAE